MKLDGTLGTSKTALQIDIGFGDVVVPESIIIDDPAMIDLPAPQLKACTKECASAEKLHALVFLGCINSRVKDFYDLWFLVNRFDFDGKTIAESIKQTITRRKTDIDSNPVALQSGFAKNQQTHVQWSAFCRKLQIDRSAALPDFGHVIVLIKTFILPPLRALQTQLLFNAKWRYSSQQCVPYTSPHRFWRRSKFGNKSARRPWPWQEAVSPDVMGLCDKAFVNGA